jgi:hypothetical protein
MKLIAIRMVALNIIVQTQKKQDSEWTDSYKGFWI